MLKSSIVLVPTPTPTPEGGTITVLSNDLGFLRIREGPSTATEEIGQIPVGESAPFDDAQNGWYHMTYQSIAGWVSGTYVSVNE